VKYRENLLQFCEERRVCDVSALDEFQLIHQLTSIRGGLHNRVVLVEGIGDGSAM
jgi:hypothetical protein